MKKTVYLIPPSEGKKADVPSPGKTISTTPNPSFLRRGINAYEHISFSFEKPCEIASNATEKDLKCKGKRFEEGIELNKRLCDVSRRVRMHSHPTDVLKNSPTIPFNKGEEHNSYRYIPAIERYSGVMYNAINYNGMSDSGKQFFEQNFLILSGMYGILKPLDTIGNYKLPIETKGLLDFWGTQVIEALNHAGVTKVVNLLPDSYAKLIYGKNKTQQKLFAELREFEIEDQIFYKEDGKKMTHGVKRVKGEWIREVCENS